MGCATKIVRPLFFVFNLVVWGLGVAALSIGVYSRVENDSWVKLLDTDTLFQAANLLIAAGAIVAVIGFFGCCGAVKRSQWMLTIYCVLVMVIFVLEVAAGAYAYANEEKVEEQLTRKLSETVKLNFGDESNTSGKGFTKAVNWFHQKVHCCGVKNATDWQTSKWYTTFNITNAAPQVPDSCCKVENTGCGANITSYADDDKIYTQGCVSKTKEFAKKNLNLVGGVAIGVAVFESLAIIVGVCLICSFKEEDKVGAAA